MKKILLFMVLFFGLVQVSFAQCGFSKFTCTPTFTPTLTKTRTPTKTPTPTLTTTPTFTPTPGATQFFPYMTNSSKTVLNNGIGAFTANQVIFGTSTYDEIGGFGLFNNPTKMMISSDGGNLNYFETLSNGGTEIHAHQNIVLQTDLNDILLDPNGGGSIFAQGPVKAASYAVVGVGSTPTPGTTGAVTILSSISATPVVIQFSSGIRVQ